MLSKEELSTDARFFVNPITLDEIFRRFNHCIEKYDLTCIKVGKLRRTLEGRLSPMYKTEPFLFIRNPENKEIREMYEKYCELPDARKDNPERSVEYYKNFICKFTSEYDVKKGIVVIDQYNRIQDGLHRSCILLKNMGPNYEIQVLRIFPHYSLRTRFKLLRQMYWYDLKHFLHII